MRYRRFTYADMIAKMVEQFLNEHAALPLKVTACRFMPPPPIIFVLTIPSGVSFDTVKSV